MELLRQSVIEDVEAMPMKIQLISITDEPLDRRPQGTNIITGVPRPEIVRHLQFVRTDLDEFSNLEVDLLLRHGFTVAYRVLTGDLAPTTPVDTAWSVIDPGPTPDSETIQQYASTLAKSQKRRLGLFNPKD